MEKNKCLVFACFEIAFIVRKRVCFECDSNTLGDFFQFTGELQLNTTNINAFILCVGRFIKDKTKIKRPIHEKNYFLFTKLFLFI